MKRKASLILMEQLVMVLVFAVAAALCVQLFVGTYTISVRNGQRDEALWIAQNTAEQLKTGAQLEERFSQGEYEVEIQPAEAAVPGLAQAEIVVFLEDKPLISLTVGRQEVLP